MHTEEDIRAAFRALAAEADAATLPTAGQGETLHRQASRGRRRWTILAPVTAAAVVIALVVSLSVVLGGAGNRPSQAAVAAEVKQSLPPYFLAIHYFGHVSSSSQQDVLVRSSLTGATLATVHAPEPYLNFIAVTGAADDRTFVLAAQRTSGRGWHGPVAFFLGQLNSDGKHLTLKLLKIQKVPGPSVGPQEALLGLDLLGLALSPDGASLAMMTSTRTGGGTAPAQLQLKVYSLATGAVKVWRAPGHNFIGYNDALTVSWSVPGEVTFNWADDFNHGYPRYSVRLLPVSSGGGNLLADSQLIVPAREPGGFGPLDRGIVTADGRAVVVVLNRTRWSHTGHNPPGQYEGSTLKVGILSTATGKLIRAIPVPANSFPNLVWSNSSGSVIVVGPIDITDLAGNPVREVVYAFGNNARIPIINVGVRLGPESSVAAVADLSSIAF